MPAPRETVFPETHLVAIAKVLESAATHQELGSLLRDSGLGEPVNPNGLAKWKRIYNSLGDAQNRTRTGNFVMKSSSLLLRRGGLFSGRRTSMLFARA